MARDKANRRQMTLALPCSKSAQLMPDPSQAPERVPGIVAGFIAGIVALLRWIGEAIRYARIRHQSIRELSRLRDSDLRDMGIGRHQIEASVDRMMQQARDKQ